jgi:hypothetical protein
MSCKQSALGNIILPQKSYKDVVNSILALHHQFISKDYTTFNSIITTILEDNKGKRNIDWKRVIESSIYTNKSPFELFQAHEMVYLLQSLETKPKTVRIPKLAKIAERNVIVFDDTCIEFEKSSHTMTIDVSYNNKAVDRFQQNLFVKSLLTILNSIEWTPQTGGVIESTNEHHQDSMREPFTLYKWN